MSYVVTLGRGIGMLVSSFIYIVIQQRLLFLVFAILNVIAMIIYSIYFFFTRTKTSKENVCVLNNHDSMIEAGRRIDLIKHTYMCIFDLDIPLNEKMIPSSTNNDNEQ